jgi:hypothetical protein
MKTWVQEQDHGITNEFTANPNHQDEAEERRIHSFLNQHGLQALS